MAVIKQRERVKRQTIAYRRWQHCNRQVVNAPLHPHIEDIASLPEHRATESLTLPLIGEAHMDINYILGREQVSLYRASVAASAPARIAHKGLAAAYGQLLTDSSFPHRIPIALQFRPAPLDDISRWEGDGGPATPTAYDRNPREGAPTNALPIRS